MLRQSDLADGATNQAAVVEELTATVAGVSEQVEQNSKSAKEISGKVDGHFDAQPEVEWKGDFVGILHSFMEFEKSMAVIIKGIQNVSSEVSSAAEQERQEKALRLWQIR